MEAARIEGERLEAARQAAARTEAARAASERQEAARAEAARAEAVRAEGERQEGERREAAKQEAARQEKLAVRAQEDARRDAVRKAMGRQLDEEAAKRDAAARAANPSSTLPPSWSTARRGRLFGRADSNAELVLYAEAWSRKIELNMTFDMVRDAAKQRHTHPVVTVALRSDGSVEAVTFVVSSGVPAIDDAVRRIVQSQAPYRPFPAALARDYDVIEIRRTWYFDAAVRLY
jgi:outer membrane biosynthesis protein TonB